VNTSQIIELILGLVAVAPDLVAKLMANAKQTGELTPAEWQALKDRADAAFASPAFQTDQKV
jgi:hypothetical protein